MNNWLPRVTVTYGPLFYRVPQAKTMKDIVQQVAASRGVSVEDIRGPSRIRQIAAARQEAMWRIRNELSKSWGVIGRHFDRDHTTVMYGVRAHQARIGGKESREIFLEKRRASNRARSNVVELFPRP